MNTAQNHSDDSQKRERNSRLHGLLTAHLSVGELRTLCFNLGVEYDDLPDVGRVNKVRELIAYFSRQQRIAELIEVGRSLRSDVPWHQVLEELDEEGATQIDESPITREMRCGLPNLAYLSDDSQERKRNARLLDLMIKRLDDGELRTLCFKLGIDYNDLPVVGRTNKARELIAYLDRRQRIAELIEVGGELRPDVPWQQVFEGLEDGVPAQVDESPITWEMRRGLPNLTYLNFVTFYLLQQKPHDPLIDPFSPDRSVDQAEDIYVVRQDVENEIGQADNRIILGPQGSGKSTLSVKLLRLLGRSALTVRLSLNEVGARIPPHDLKDGKVSLLPAELLVSRTFDAFWQDFLRSPLKRARFFPQLRRDHAWMSTLRWFYQRYRPRQPEIPDEFEFMAWLNASSSSQPFGSDISSRNALRELVDLITAPALQQGRFGPPLSAPCHQIHLLIDGGERLPEEAIRQALEDVQSFLDLRLERLRLKLFADLAWEPQIRSMACVRQGRIGLYRLPQWRAQELHQLLNRRLTDASPALDWPSPEYDWGPLIPDIYLTPAAKPQFIKLILEGALRAYETQDAIDAPVHTLRLARGLVAACAGCWERLDFIPPLNVEHLTTLIDLYWRTR